MGDSIPFGLSASLPDRRGYPAILRGLMEAQRRASDTPGSVELINIAEPGETVQSFIDDGQLQTALELIEENRDDLRTVTLSLGGNDILALWGMPGIERETDLERFEQAFVQVIDQIAGTLDGTEVDVVVTTYYDLTEGDRDVSGSDSWWLARFNSVIREVTGEAGFQVVDLDDVFRGEILELTWFPADIHPNNAGHRAIAGAIWRTLDYDETEPDVSISRPANGQTRSRLPTIHAEVTDDVGVERVELLVDGESLGTLTYVPRLDRYVGLWDARRYPDSEAELTVVATDLAGNQASDSVTVNLPAR
jgi:lysophospholipase L1-like esterase